MNDAQAPDTSLAAPLVSSWLDDLRTTSGRTDGNSRVRTPAHAHVFYGSAARFKADTFTKMRAIACATWEKYFPSAHHLTALGSPIAELPVDKLSSLHTRIAQKLSRHPVESFRIDFEDGLGPCDDRNEDVFTRNAATSLHAALGESASHDKAFVEPKEVGIRLKALQPATAHRALRTLDIFFNCWRNISPARGGHDFVVTLPKVERAAEVRILSEALEQMETRLGWPAGTIGIEVMVESPALLFPGPDQQTAADSLEEVLAAGKKRVRSVHFGIYDFLAAANIDAPHQKHAHPLARRAREELLLRTWHAGIHAVDGATHEMPIGPHRAAANESLSPKQEDENRSIVGHALNIHMQNVLRAFETGLRCGWDLHPAQLIARWTAVLHSYRYDLRNQLERLLSYLERAKQADRTGAYFDDAASAAGVFHFFRNGWRLGAIDDSDLEQAGWSDAQVQLVLSEFGFTSTCNESRGSPKLRG